MIYVVTLYNGLLLFGWWILGKEQEKVKDVYGHTRKYEDLINVW